jgi:serine/threonine protein kinase
MAHTALEKWFRSGKYAQVNGSRVRPVPHPVMQEEPLTIQKGQAVAICLICDDGSKWILKKFHPGKNLDRCYLESVTALLPRLDGFIAGTQRQILSSGKVTRVHQCYYANDLVIFIDDSMLMPQVGGDPWSGLADEIREGQIQLSKVERIALCHHLVELIAALEDSNCSHRDISSGNIFIDIATGKIYFIDFDSLFHPSLAMPKSTTCGTIGYAPPFAWRGDVMEAKRTWCPHADRYALGILVTEFCILDKGSPMTSDGGMFDQDELRSRSGPGLNSAMRALITNWPNLSSLFEATINSRDFESCPGPRDWKQAIDRIFPKPPSLADIEGIPAGYFEKILKNASRPAIIFRPPALSEIPEFKVELRNYCSNVLTLPPNPWN